MGIIKLTCLVICSLILILVAHRAFVSCSAYFVLLICSGFPCGSAGKESTRNADLGCIPGLGRSPGEGKGYPLQCSGLENPMDYSWGCKKLDTTEQLSLSVYSMLHGYILCLVLFQTLQKELVVVKGYPVLEE